MVKKKNDDELEDVEYPEDPEELDLEEAEDEEVVEQPDELASVKEAMTSIEARMQLFNKAITANQKYLKLMWERIGKLEDNFKLLLESKQ